MAVRQMLSLILTYVLRILVNDRADVDVSCTFVFLPRPLSSAQLFGAMSSIVTCHGSFGEFLSACTDDFDATALTTSA
jgi:hypothetical protein